MPTDTATRLQSCFQAVFPALGPEQIVKASPVTLAEWDSIHHVTLINVIEEEFGIVIDPEHVDGLTTWDGFLRYVETHR